LNTFIGASDYHANNIRKEHKNNPTPNNDSDHIEFCASFKKLIQELMVYVKEYHLTGVTWDSKGINVSDYNDTSSSESSEKPIETSTIQLKEEGAVTEVKSTASKVDLLGKQFYIHMYKYVIYIYIFVNQSYNAYLIIHYIYYMYSWIEERS
jgi:hypothetical protein